MGLAVLRVLTDKLLPVLFLFACAPKAAAVDSPPCARVAGPLLALTTSLDAVEVVVDLTGEITTPPSWKESARTDLSRQGTVTGTELCALADQPNVLGVRRPFLARPK